MWNPELDGPPILKTGTPEEIQRSAIAASQTDIAAGKPQIAFTGTIACMPIGVPPEHLALVEKLPRLSLPCGCATPLVREAIIYAEAYNKEILAHLLEANKTHR